MIAQSIVRSDAATQHEVRREMEWETCIPETAISVAVAHGLVTLSGTVDSDATKEAAQEAAHRVRGVLDVVNDIVVQIPGRGGLGDADIARAARRALECEPLLPHQRIRTTVSDGWVTLDGVVERHSERDGAERMVRHLLGVQGISNRIVIIASPADPQEVRRSIEAALERLASPTVEPGGPGPAPHITVTVAGSTVTLCGRVESWAEQRAAVGTVEHVPGVRAVVDHLRIESSEIES